MNAVLRRWLSFFVLVFALALAGDPRWVESIRALMQTVLAVAEAGLALSLGDASLDKLTSAAGAAADPVPPLVENSHTSGNRSRVAKRSRASPAPLPLVTRRHA